VRLKQTIKVMLHSDFIPNLPGFKPHDIHRNGKRVNHLRVFEGIRFVLENESGSSLHGNASTSSLDLNASASITSLGSVAPGKHPQGSHSEYPILKFDAIFGTRKASILYYVEDSSMKIIEVPEVNSGISQGVFLRRSVVPKPDGTPLTIDDFRIGDSIEIYGRTFSIIDCNNMTRAYLNDLGWEIPSSEKYDNIDKVKDDCKANWSKFRPKKNNLKEFMEAKLGNTVNTKGREGFMEFGSQVLKFLCSWDDTEVLFGDRREFVVIYHLADDTIEIFNAANSSIKQFPKLLKRCQLPKEFGSSSLLAGGNDADQHFYHWSDFYVGAQLQVYARTLTVLDADTKTRQFFEARGEPLGDAIRIDDNQSTFTFSREIPPHTGFGSEEDSLKSCIGPLSPTSHIAKTNIEETRAFVFFAKLITSDAANNDRKFVITVYKQDGTIKVQEPPLRNSGFVGGVFLSRRKVKRFGTNDNLTERDFEIGSQIRILQHVFEITGANEFTMKWMDMEGLLPRRCEAKN